MHGCRGRVESWVPLASPFGAASHGLSVARPAAWVPIVFCGSWRVSREGVLDVEMAGMVGMA